MPEKTRIAILGIGAVGGYFGGLLAERYLNSGDIEIIFIARERSVEVIRKKGLKIITPTSEKIVFPHTVSNDPEKMGRIDYLICCVKSYDLAESLLSLRSCIHSRTIILPLLNGVDAKPIIHSVFPKAQVWDGCVYIISRLIEPGVITEGGKIHTLHFGSEEKSEQQEIFNRILQNAGIESHSSEDIEQTVWEKFVFISVVASITSYLNLAIGPVLEHKEHRKIVQQLLQEITAVAKAKKIRLPENIIEKTLATMERMPYETTSSMHSDFMKGGKTEYRSLTEFVVQEGKRLNVETPEYEKILRALEAKACY